MEREKINLMKVQDLKIDSEPKKVIHYKPKFAIYSTVVISLIIIVYGVWQGILFWIFGAICLPFAIFVAIKTPDYIHMEFYKEFFVVFDKDHENCQKFTYDNIIQWKVAAMSGRGNALSIELADKKFDTFETFYSKDIYRFLNEVIPDKNSNKIRKSKVGSRYAGIKFPWRKDKDE